MPVCRKCKDEKTNAEMVTTKAGTIKKICLGCSKKPAEAGGGGGKAVKTKKKAKAKKPKAKVKAAAETLHIAPGFGCEAAIKDGILEVNQRDGAGDVVDTVVLSKGEFRALVEKYSGWAAA